MIVYIFTTCRHRERLYGATLVFDTLRVGFPTARVVCADNGSQAGRAEIERAARGAGCEFVQLDKQRIHADFMEWALVKNQGLEEPVVFVDPDVIFWGAMEDLRFGDALVAGRLMPEFDSGKGRDAPRLHPSLLWIPSPAALYARAAAIRRELWDFRPFHPFAFFDRGKPRHFDTAAALYSCLEPHEAAAFGESHLDLYDHLFIGTAIDYVKPALPPAVAEWFESLHRKARTDPASLRGVWREQDRLFATMRSA